MNPITNQDEKTVLLRGGPRNGELLRVPRHDWNLIHNENGERTRYVRIARVEVWASDDDTTVYLDT